MRKLVITCWNRGNATDPGKRVELTWGELTEWICKHGKGPPHPIDPRTKESTVRWPCWSPAEYTGDRRSLATLERCHVVGLDFDDGACSWRELRGRLASVGLEYFMYTTKSHTSALNALRVLFPLEAPVNAADYRKVRDWLNAELEGKADNNARDPSRYWWQPAPPSARGQPFETWRERGRWARVEDVPPPPLVFELPEQPPPEPARAKASPVPAPAPKGEENRNGAEPDPRVVRRANRLLGKLTGEVGMAPEGQREKTLNKAAALIAGKPQLVAVLGKEAVIGSLVRAAVQAGLPEQEARSKATRAFEWGADRPLPLSGQEQAEKDHIALPDRGEGGKISATLRNTMAVVTSQRYAKLFVWDEMAGELRRTSPVPGSSESGPGQVLDSDVDALRHHIAERYAFDPGREHAWSAVGLVARQARVHPVRTWLRTLKWDGTPRVDTMLPDYFGCQPQVEAPGAPNTLARLAQAARVLMLSAIARVERPGCKADICVVFHGAQALKKSTSFGALAGPDWFSDAHLDFRDPQGASMAIRGKWIVELSELSAVRGRDVEPVKAFLTRAVDRFRPPYGRAFVEWPRQCVFVGTSNDRQPFQDRTGNRRFFSVFAADRADDTAIRLRRDQLWAEAFHRFQIGERWWLEAEEEAAAALVQEQFTAPDGDDAWVQPIGAYLAAPTRTWVTVKDLLWALNFEVPRMGKADELRVAQIMAQHFPSWRRARRRMAEGQVRGYERTENAQ